MTLAVAAVDMVVSGTTEIVVSGDRPDLVAGRAASATCRTRSWHGASRTQSPLWEGREQPAAYVCRNFVCGLPATSVDDLADQLGAGPLG